jgi:hypothetical protein
MVSSGAGTSLAGASFSPPLGISSPAGAISVLQAATIPAGNLRTLFVYLCNGTVEVVGLCRNIKLSDSEMIVQLADGSARRFRRADVYLASWGQVTPPVMF